NKLIVCAGLLEEKSRGEWKGKWKDTINEKTLERGALVDAMDSGGRWCRGQILRKLTEVCDDQKQWYLIHYYGWPHFWDAWVTSNYLRPPFWHSRHCRFTKYEWYFTRNFSHLSQVVCAAPGHTVWERAEYMSRSVCEQVALHGKRMLTALHTGRSQWLKTAERLVDYTSLPLTLC